MQTLMLEIKTHPSIAWNGEKEGGRYDNQG